MNRNQLKLIAIISMIIDHIASVFVTNQTLYFIMRMIIGRIAFPIFCILIVDSFIYTKKPLVHIRDLFIFGIISEIFYDLTFYNKLEFNNQNIMLTWFICYSCLYLLQKIISSKYTKLDTILYTSSTIFIFCIISYILNMDYNILAILSVSIIYLMFKFKTHNYIYASFIIFLLSVLIFFSFGTILCIPLLALYKPNKVCKYKLKYIFYYIYPLHLLVLFILNYL